jgi:subtilisin family serine protease
MRDNNRIHYTCILIICVIVISLLNQTIVSAQEAKIRYLISFKNEIDYNLIYELEGKVLKEYQDDHMMIVEISEEIVSKLQQYPQIDFFEPDLKINVTPGLNAIIKSNDTDFLRLHSVQEIPWGIQRINAIEAQKRGSTGKNIKIGIIDSGIDYTHDDLLVAGGINIIDNNSDFIDDYGHGTQIAGIIGAQNNSLGVLGVAPDSSLFAIKVLDSKGDGFISDVISGIQWSIENDINIVNLSFQTKEDSKALKKIIKKAHKEGILLIASAGNNGFNEGNTIEYPAAYPEVIAVGAINSRDERTFYSGRGEKLELMAPGASIYSTTLNNNYALTLGTSMAAAHVTGVAAQIMEKNQELDNQEVQSILDKTATAMGEKTHYGHGLVDALKALIAIE